MQKQASNLDQGILDLVATPKTLGQIVDAYQILPPSTIEKSIIRLLDKGQIVRQLWFFKPIYSQARRPSEHSAESSAAHRSGKGGARHEGVRVQIERFAGISSEAHLKLERELAKIMRSIKPESREYENYLRYRFWYYTAYMQVASKKEDSYYKLRYAFYLLVERIEKREPAHPMLATLPCRYSSATALDSEYVSKTLTFKISGSTF